MQARVNALTALTESLKKMERLLGYVPNRDKIQEFFKEVVDIAGKPLTPALGENRCGQLWSPLVYRGNASV